MNTSSNVNVKFLILPNSSFSLLGFHIIIIAKPFDEIFKYEILNINVHNQLIKKIWQFLVHINHVFISKIFIQKVIIFDI
jgi:hypothetical protein